MSILSNYRTIPRSLNFLHQSYHYFCVRGQSPVSLLLPFGLFASTAGSGHPTTLFCHRLSPLSPSILPPYLRTRSVSCHSPATLRSISGPPRRAAHLTTLFCRRVDPLSPSILPLFLNTQLPSWQSPATLRFLSGLLRRAATSTHFSTTDLAHFLHQSYHSFQTPSYPPGSLLPPFGFFPVYYGERPPQHTFLPPT